MRRGLALLIALTACGARTGLIVEPPSAPVTAVDASIVPPSACEWPPATLVVQLGDGPGGHAVGDAVSVGGRVLIALHDAPGARVYTQWIGSLGERLAGPSAPVAPSTALAPEFTLSLAADDAAPRGLLAADASGVCAFVPLAADGSPGRALVVGTATPCSSLHAQGSTRFDMLFSDRVPSPSLYLASLGADGSFLSSRRLGVSDRPARAARAFRDDGSFELAYVSSSQLLAWNFDIDGTTVRDQASVSAATAASMASLVSTPQGFVLAFGPTPADPRVGSLHTASIALDGSLAGATRALGAAFDTVGPGDAVGFDLAYSNGDVLLAEVRPGAVAGTNDLDFATLTLDGVPRAVPVRLTSAPGLFGPRIVATSVGVVIVFNALAADGSTQVFSIGLNCLR